MEGVASSKHQCEHDCEARTGVDANGVWTCKGIIHDALKDHACGGKSHAGKTCSHDTWKPHSMDQNISGSISILSYKAPYDRLRREWDTSQKNS